MARRAQKAASGLLGALCLSILAGAGPVEAEQMQTGTALNCPDELIVVVMKIDRDLPFGTGLHVQMLAEGEILADHLPFEVAAFDGCVEVSGFDFSRVDIARFEAGWAVWDDAKGGYFSIPPAEVAELFREMAGQ